MDERYNIRVGAPGPRPAPERVGGPPAVSPRQQRLEQIRQLASEVAEAERQAQASRERLQSAIRASYPAIPQARLAEASGLSRQRISQIVADQ